MTRRERQDRWRDAFARQARADKRAYEVLCAASLRACHRLHFLQVFLEKLCKALSWADLPGPGAVPAFLRSHGVIAKVLPTVARE